ncbi:hypothetical protein Syun_007455 [Stephania yunnanensis]|uniref:DUF6737 domain-containing protein n=1 Tax=Stephania yunnanensis TaxID=152371 RepID=A0AAP0L254_9MAGN
MALSIFPLSIPHFQRHPSKPHLSNGVISPTIASNEVNFSNLRRKSTALRSNQSESFESKFKDENGVVDDMNGYLNYLSLEYDSVWDTKPSWCQPWTIVLTGVLAIAGSWAILQSVVISGIILSLISAWWYVFLHAYPKSYTNMIAERRKKVTSGMEDTFGVKKSQ